MCYSSLLIGTAQISNAFGLSSLPSLEARVGHLLLMRLEVRSRTKVLDHTSPVDLKTLFEDLSSTEILGAKVEGTGNHTLPSKAEVNTSVGQERSFRTGSSRDVSSNVRREGVAASSSLAAEQDDEDGDTESSDADAAAHLREAAIVQMAELGLPRQWAELALSRVGGTNIEAAVHFCLERGGDMERLLAEETQRRGPSSFVSGRRRAFGVTRLNSSNLIRQLAEMGFPQHWCVEALTATGNNVDEALTWILMNGDRLTVDDEAVEEEHDEDTGNDDDDDESEEDEVENDENHDDNDNDEEEEVCTANNIEQGVDDRPVSRVDKSGWSDICPVRCVFGRPDINPISLEVVGSPSGESSAVGTKGILLTAGKWYYEVEVKTAGCIHIGWADSSFSGHSQIDQSDGCGNGPHTWTYDGWRRYRWHGNATGLHPPFHSNCAFCIFAESHVMFLKLFSVYQIGAANGTQATLLDAYVTWTL